MSASSARTGSTSVTMTWAPRPRARSAIPLPHGPKPATTTTFPASSVLVARRIPSITDCPVPQKLSNMRLVRDASAATIGNASVPSAAIRRSLATPVVVDSQPPRTPAQQLGPLGVQRVHQVAAVVDDQVGRGVQGPVDVLVVGAAGPPRTGRRR